MISGEAPRRDRLEISWDIADGYYLYNNRFLGFTALTPGVEFGTPELPQGKKEFDGLLGEEVEKWTGRISVGLPQGAVQPSNSHRNRCAALARERRASIGATAHYA